MNDLERELSRIEARVKAAKKQAKDEQRAQTEKDGFCPVVETEEITYTKETIKCGNCGKIFLSGEVNSFMYLTKNTLPKFCSSCGAKVRY